MNQIQVHPASEVVTPNKSDDHGAPRSVDKTGAGYYAPSENESHNGGVAGGNAILERDAQTKQRWFQYLKTKQFWITLAIGQGA